MLLSKNKEQRALKKSDLSIKTHQLLVSTESKFSSLNYVKGGWNEQDFTIKTKLVNYLTPLYFKEDWVWNTLGIDDFDN